MRDAKVLMIAACLGFVAASPNLLAQAGGGTTLPQCGNYLREGELRERCCQAHENVNGSWCNGFNRDYYRERVTPVSHYEHGYIVQMCTLWKTFGNDQCCGVTPLGLPVTPGCPANIPTSSCVL